jgi:ferredoxin--NADP+ reductase/benzoate/toluate 1,2-dioxygenase reductase subunit
MKYDLRMQYTDVKTTYYIQNIRRLTGDTFSIRMNRNGLQFKAGQHIMLGIKGDYNSREYSIYSGEDDPFLEVLVKEINDGYLSPMLTRLQTGQEMEVHGPKGYFTIDKKKLGTHKFVLIASGTGIAPFKSFVFSYPGMDYEIIHGIRYAHEAYDQHLYDEERYVSCTSRDSNGKFNGRVTDYLKNAEFDSNTLFYFCGNSQMIFDAMDILKAKGFGRNEMFAEIYF